MNKDDEYAFFIMLALLDPDKNRRYFFNRDKKELFGTERTDEGHLRPIFRNPHVQPGADRIAEINKNIDALGSGDKAIVELPRVSHDEKREFLMTLSNHIPSNEARSYLINNIKTLESDRSLWIASNLRIGDFDGRLLFDKMKNSFVLDRFTRLYYPLGVTEHGHVIW